jgi:hypothetical protein
MTSVGGASAASTDWPAQATETIETVVVTVRDRSVKPLTTVARAIVFGLLAIAVTQVVVVLASVGILRLLDIYLFPKRVWASYTFLGGIFTVIGLFLWTLRRSKPKR